MILAYLYALLSVVAVSLVSLVGVFTLSLREDFLRKYIYIFISLAAGALIGDVFIHIIPEVLETSAGSVQPSLLIVAGILLFFLIEKFFHWHHHGEDAHQPHRVHPVGKLVLFSDGVHNFTDGIIIGASFLVSLPVGIATTIAVVLHEIPQEVGDFVVLLHAGYSRVRALWLNLLSGLTAVLGLMVAFLIGSVGESVNLWMLSLVAGGFIYIAVADLIPELHKTKEWKYSLLQIAMVIVGIAAMFSLTFFE